VLDELRRERAAVAELPDILSAVDDDEMAPRIDKAAVAGAEPAVLGKRVPRRLGLLVISLEDRGGADQHLAVRGDADFRPREDRTDGVGIRLAVGLHEAAPESSVAPHTCFRLTPKERKKR